MMSPRSGLKKDKENQHTQLQHLFASTYGNFPHDSYWTIQIMYKIINKKTLLNTK